MENNVTTLDTARSIDRTPNKVNPMKSNHEEIQARLHHAEAIADLISVAEPAHLCEHTLANAAEAIRVLLQQAREMHAVAELDRNMPAAMRRSVA